jgi:hypothetical protein
MKIEYTNVVRNLHENRPFGALKRMDDDSMNV